MPRFARRTVAGALVHCISRVVDGELRIDDHARADYLRRVARLAPRVRWRLLAYALMSNHIHWLLLCMGAPIRELIHPLHGGFAHWLNRRDNRLTPVFAERPSTYLFEPAECLRLIAYVHNNPVRAGVVGEASASSWTSHRAYCGRDPAPPWLDVELGLSLCELPGGRVGRQQLASAVASLASAPRDPLYGSERMNNARRTMRKRMNAPVELASPVVRSGELEHLLIGVEGMPVRERWDGSLSAVVRHAARALGVASDALMSRSREPDLVRARRLVVLTASEYLGRTIAEASVSMGLSTSAGSKLLRRASTEELDSLGGLAREIADRLRLGDD